MAASEEIQQEQCSKEKCDLHNSSILPVFFFLSFSKKNLLGGDNTGKQFFRGCPLGVEVLESVKVTGRKIAS